MAERVATKVEIHLTSPGRGTISVDGVQVNSVVGLSLEAEGHKSTVVVLRLAPEQVVVTAEEADVIARYLERPAAPEAVQEASEASEASEPDERWFP